jgi:demethylmenaquinone methyltransferase/2-methoxy-6-polyprenyl-1,4-benzoquinol methylase
MTSKSKKTHFGFKEVDKKDKAKMVHNVFSSVSSKYDVMNDVMSFGIHRIWKNSMMDWLTPKPNQKLLDVAGGTGDISFRFLKRAPTAHATVFDMTQSMLDEGQLRSEAEKNGKSPRLGLW